MEFKTGPIDQDRQIPSPTAAPNPEGVRALCVLPLSPETMAVYRFLADRQVTVEEAATFQAAERKLLDSRYDLVLVDADLDFPEGDVAGFMSFCRSRHLGLPIVAIHGGALGQRGAALIRMGAFDSFPRDLDRWNTLVFLERAVAQARINKQILHLSRTDHLTGLYNQRFLYESLEKEVQRAKRMARRLSVALLDMDNFKAFNDTYGHLEGDRTLSRVGTALAEAIRAGQDAAFRYGGDEFMLLFPETAPPDAQVVLERVLASVKRCSPRPVTFSVGVTEGGSYPDVASLMKAVDSAMYTAKEAGGDRIHLLRSPGRGDAV
jgi:two-component system, cell cycle response regulator